MAADRRSQAPGLARGPVRASLVAGVVAPAVLVAAVPHRGASAALGLRTGPAPWPPEYAHLAQRLGVLRAHDRIVVGIGPPGSFPARDSEPFPPGL